MLALWSWGRRAGVVQVQRQIHRAFAGSSAAAYALRQRVMPDARAWITYTDEQAHYEPARWVQRQIEQTGEPVALRASSMLMHLEAIRAGTGRGVLPCYVG